ncbi:MAG: YggS family pyridoxal phosphate-dependent enzyme [Gammaproteobacteria bacterium]|jgi:PLP dependent protein|nr:YggS family pyridoxal phosphate-dependent enzyme [Gammaproteobacteria bacterium]MBT7308072.1 YggS family pyridoxal phosphate-dependent enzyme [Gammaproteobacteria bacterium]
MAIDDQLNQVQQRINHALMHYGHPSNQVALLAVSKTKPTAMVEAAYRAGQRDFGENYLQDALEKIEALPLEGIVWHFIGAIQSNKSRPLAEYFDWVHGVDRLKIARRLSEQRPADRAPLNLCIQVNSSGEPNKAGVSFAQLPELAQQIAALPNIRLRGLMTLPAPTADFEQQRAPFRALRKALEQLNHEGLTLDTLSMGMSADMEAAIAEGATIVRIGTDIFGARQ